MHPESLQDFIALLERSGQLRRVGVPVDPELEVAAIISRVSKGAGNNRALLFEDVTGADMPLAANLFGSGDRLALALGVDSVAQLADRLRHDLAKSGQPSSAEALLYISRRPQWCPVYPDAPPCFAVDLTNRGLSALPALRAWPQDGGRYLTLGQVFTSDPDTGAINCGMYRLQVVDRTTALLRCHPGSGGGAHLAAWHERGKAAPVAIALGGPAVMTWVAGMPLPDTVDEVDFAGYLMGRQIGMARCRCSDLHVPANAEIVIEGCIPPGETRPEGPFGNHTGYYQPATPAPVMHVERLWTRVNPVCPGTVVGPPPMENVHLAAAASELLLPLLQYDHSWVSAVHLPHEGIYHRAAQVALEPDCNLSRQEICEALRSSVVLKQSRLLVLLDRGAPLGDFGKVYWRVVNALSRTNVCQPGEQGLVVDARAAAGMSRVTADPGVTERIDRRWSAYGLDKPEY